MKHLLFDTSVFILAYVVAFFLRFDFQTPPWGWRLVLAGLPSFLLVGWISVILCTGFKRRWRTLTFKEMPRIGLATLCMVMILMTLRLIFSNHTDIYIRPPFSVIFISGLLSLVGLLSLRYLSRIQIRPIEISDILDRTEITPQTKAAIQQGFSGKCVVITGAGGSIGSELVRQVYAAKPRRLILIDISERSLYDIFITLPEDKAVRAVVADCGDRDLIRQLLESERPEIVLHAAAYKHVPLMEFNPVQALQNNALTTRIMAEESARAEVDTFLLISTDKAIRPISAMGLSKRLAELFIRDLATPECKTRFCAVRFGNVLNSSGSVIPRFRKQLAKGGPLTLTDPRMMRYFMTIPEAAGLVLQTATCAQKGEIYVLDMGDPVSIKSIAETMIKLSGLRPYKDIDIITTGIRPGEKLSEELGIAAANAVKTPYDRIFIGQIPQLTHEQIATLLSQCESLVSKKLDLTKDDLEPLFKTEGVV